MEIEIFLKLVHFHITPALFYISGADMKSSMDERELAIMEATAEGIVKSREVEAR